MVRQRDAHNEMGGQETQVVRLRIALAKDVCGGGSVWNGGRWWGYHHMCAASEREGDVVTRHRAEAIVQSGTPWNHTI